MANQTQIPSARVPLVESENGLISREWFRYLNNLNILAGGGTGVTPITGGGTGLTSVPANGQLLIGNGSGYSLNDLTAGTNIAIANGLGNIAISFSGTLTPEQGGTGLAATPGIGAILIGNGSNYSLGSVAAGPGVTISNDGTTISISLSGGGYSGPPGADGQDAEDVTYYVPPGPSNAVSLMSGVSWTSGTGTPQGAVVAPVGSLFTRLDGGANTTLYVKESGTGNTGWVAK